MRNIYLLKMLSFSIFLLTCLNSHCFDNSEPKKPTLEQSKITQFKADYRSKLKQWASIRGLSYSDFVGVGMFPLITSSQELFEYKERIRHSLLIAGTYYEGAKRDPILLKEHAEVKQKNNALIEDYKQAIKRYEQNNRVNWSFY